MCGTMMGPPEAPSTIQPKYKRKNNEQRKEKSRDAARDRRAKESQLFQDLEDLLPVSGTQDVPLIAMDKTTLIRLTLSHLKCRDVVEKGLELPDQWETDPLMTDSEMLGSIDAFSLVLSHEMDVIFVSNNVANHIGINSLELLGQPICDYVHPCDHHQLKAVLNPKGEKHREAYVRVKVTVTDRGRMINLRQANYKVLKISGITRSFDSGNKAGVKDTVFLGMGQLIGRESTLQDENKFEHSGIFHTKHSADMKFLETDLWLSTVAQYPSYHTQGTSFYEFIHAEDCQKVQKALKNLCEQGQCEISPYRFLVAGGGWVWIQTKASQSIARRGSSKGCMISCTHTAISEVMNADQILALIQMVETKNSKRSKKNESVIAKEIDNIMDMADLKPFEERYDVVEILSEEPNILLKEEEDYYSMDSPKFADLLDLQITSPTPSVIVTPNKADPLVNTETTIRRTSVIVTSKQKNSVAPTQQTITKEDNRDEQDNFQTPRAVTSIVLTSTDEIEHPPREPIIVEASGNKMEEICIETDNSAIFSLPDDNMFLEDIVLPLETGLFNTILPQLIEKPKDAEMERYAPFAPDLVKIEDEQRESLAKKEEIPLFDFCEEGPKDVANENEKDISEEFFKILKEITPPTDFVKRNEGRSLFVREDKKVMWGLSNADPELDTYISQFSKTPIDPAKLYPTSEQFQYNQYQEENNIINEVWDTVVCNPTPNKPVNVPKMGPIINEVWDSVVCNPSPNKPVNVPKMGPIPEVRSRKRSSENQSSVLRMSRKSSPFAAPLFPELQKFLEVKSATTSKQYNETILEGPKRFRMEYYNRPTNVILLQK